MNKLEELKATAAKLQRQIAALEKPKTWEPQSGIWVIHGDCQVYKANFYDPTYVHTGGTRQTKEAAEEAVAAILTHNLLLAYVAEFGGGWEADWEATHNQPKYSVYYGYITRVWSADSSLAMCRSGTVYMSEECALGLVDKLNSGEVVL